jgi:uncharacterized Zn finger protein
MEGLKQMSETKLTERTIKNLASANTYQRGEEYFQDGAVSELVRRGESLSAQVEGSQFAPYDVSVGLHQGGVATAKCSCPYELGGYCKHIVAVLLAYVRNPDVVEQRRPVIEQLEELERSQLQELLSRLLDSDPHLADRIEAELAVSLVSTDTDAQANSPALRRTLVDPEPIRRQAQRMLRQAGAHGAYWDDYHSSGNVDELRRMAASAVPFLEAGDGRNALRVLEPISDTFVREWTQTYAYHDEDRYLLFEDLGNLCAEAVLSAGISEAERQDWADTFRDWQDELEQYGVDEAFWVAVCAAEQGWDDPGLQWVLAGDVRGTSWQQDDCRDDARLITARLRVLAREGRIDEYLNLALAAGNRTDYATMLLRSERLDEAVSYGLHELESPREALELAKALQNRGHHQQALDVAAAGLGMAGGTKHGYEASVVPLAHWLRDFAAGLGEAELALRSARAAYDESLSLDDYTSVEQWAGDQWAQIRPELLERLAAAKGGDGRTRIYLHEGMVDEAVESVKERKYLNAFDDTLLQVVTVACGSHPDWVIQVCRRQADDIMNGGQAGLYDRAAQWLERAKRAFVAAGRNQEWSAYLESLIQVHKRKYKLRPMLEHLR